MTDTVRFRIKNGGCELEVEGPASEVNDLVSTWWPVIADQKDHRDEEPSESDKPAAAKRAKTSRRAKSGGARKTDSTEVSIDANSVANSIKEDQKFARFSSKVLLKGSVWDKARFVLWYVGEDITSGDIWRVLDALDVKIALPTVSTALNRNSNSVIMPEGRQAGGTTPRYRLSANAKADFEFWLNSDDE